MKYIFDFDDVLFKNTELFKPHMFQVLEDAGVPSSEARQYYWEVREKEFSLRNFITVLLGRHVKDLEVREIEEVYLEIIRESKNFLNTELLEKIKNIGWENCYIITNGDLEFQKDKMRYSGIYDLINESRIRIVPGSKREAVFEICRENEGESVVFVDDKPKFITELNGEDKPHNLTTLIFTQEEFEKILKVGEKNKEIRLK